MDAEDRKSTVVYLNNVPSETNTEDIKTAFSVLGVEIGSVRQNVSAHSASVLIPNEELPKLESVNFVLQIHQTQVRLQPKIPKSVQVVFSQFRESGISRTDLANAIQTAIGSSVPESAITISDNGDAIATLPQRQADLIQQLHEDFRVGEATLKIGKLPISHSSGSYHGQSSPQTRHKEGRSHKTKEFRSRPSKSQHHSASNGTQIGQEQAVSAAATGPSGFETLSETTPPDPPKPPTQKPLRTLEERNLVRIQANLPILSCKEEFIRRLQEEKMLVVTAQTGSGKTTQLPQYAAEAFDGLVICTQPRAIAAISIAHRIASEFDDSEPGENVGFKIGGGKQVNGRRIMLMTDAAFVRKAQSDPELKDVRVLIIDEAHERSLNTDLVIGIAKLVRSVRPLDFFVVVASATIDPKPFLDFFSPGSCDHKELSVPGRTFSVDLEFRDLDPGVDVLHHTLIPSVIKALEDHDSGNCLVFLPGSREVDNAIKLFQLKARENWIALPLYGSLPPEEQARVLSFDDQGGALRMIVFCTNIAETSLTVPNVRLVVDSGLAKEARYDPKRRISVLEQVYISKSSADQRMGRAGRTAPGHCIRLFPPSELVRANIEPEIMRSSLDLVVLQLRRLNYDPLCFPFMNRPDEEFIRASEQLLKEFGCLGFNNHNNQQIEITERGKLFCELPFDPRMSNFVVLANECQCLEMATEIAAILTAPGSLFFLGGSKKDAREATKQRVASAASEHESDLLFLRGIYHQWVRAGTEENSSTDSKMSRLRPRYANKHSLNNKILEIVHQTKKQVIKILKNMKMETQLTPLSEPDNSSQIEIIGRCLALSFKEQICEMLLPNNPDAGAHLLDGVSKGIFSSTSAISHRIRTQPAKNDSRFVVAMSITRIPSGLIIIDQVHPLKMEWLPTDIQTKISHSSLEIVECFSRPNLSDRFRSQLFQHFQKAANQLSPFVMSTYDFDSTTVRVWGPRQQMLSIQSASSQLVDSYLKSEMEKSFEIQVHHDSFNVVVTAGLKFKSVEPATGTTVRVVLRNPPNLKKDQLKGWVCKVTNVSPDDIKSCFLNPKRSGSPRSVTVVLSGNDIFQKILATQSKSSAFQQATLSTSISEPGTENEIPQTQISIDMGNQVIFQVDHFMTVNDFQNALQSKQFPIQNVRQKYFVKDSFEIKLTNIPLDVDTEKLKTILAQIPHLDPPNFVIVFPPKGTVEACQGILKFESASHRDCALSALNQSHFASRTFEIHIPPKFKSRTVSPQFQSQNKPGKSEFVVFFTSTQSADMFCRDFQAGQISLSFPVSVNGFASIFVPHPNLFDLQTLANAVLAKFQSSTLSFEIKRDDKQSIHRSSSGDANIIFRGTPPSLCGKAAKLMQSVLAPLKLKFFNRQQVLMISELEKLGRLSEWGQQLNIIPEFKIENKIGKLVVHGSHVSQGSFMARIGEYAEIFSKRFVVLPLDSTAQLLFRGMRMGAVCLKNLNLELGNRGSVEFVPNLGGIEIYIAPEQADAGQLMQNCQDQIQQVVKKSGLTFLDEKSRACVFCGENGGQPFSICGHFHCQDCLRNTIAQQASSDSLAPITCKLCQTPVSIQNIRSALSDETIQNQVMMDFTRTFLRQSPSHPLILCPGNGCSNLLKKSDGYQKCAACSHSFCPQCGVANDELHRNKSCEEFKKLKRAIRKSGASRNLNVLFERARAFVQENWPVDMPKLTQIFENPGLSRGCPAMLSFSRCLENRGISLLQDVFFAWHGTPSEAGIIGISHEGFDPKRRSGQACGPGEYFGQSASISHGYSRSLNRMFVAALLQVPETSKHGTFCYVVNNPLDGSFCFNLPLLVLTFDTNLPPPDFRIENPMPLPPFFTDAPTSDSDED